MTDDNYYILRCQRYTTRGSGFVLEIAPHNGRYRLRHQADAHQPRREQIAAGRIDDRAPYDTRPLTQSPVEEIIATAAEITLSPIPPITGGFDGVEYRLWVQNGLSVVHFSWWMDCPQAWAPLQQIWDLMVALRPR